MCHLSICAGVMFRRGGQTTAIQSGTHRVLQTTFPDGTELHEEYNLKSRRIDLRKIRRKTTLGKDLDWQYLYGDAPSMATETVRENANNPVVTRRDGLKHFQWRIRNLHYHPEIFCVAVDHSAQCIVIRTSNRKYYKRLEIPEMALFGLKLEDIALSWRHDAATLIVSYKKPVTILTAEQRDLTEVMDAKSEDVDCRQQ